jgi:GMP synthase (glutamine-hydrolysing)
MKRAIAIRHVAFEDAGTIATALAVRGYGLAYLQAGVDSMSQAESADLLIILGGPIGVYETQNYPWLVDEIALVKTRLAAKRPTLGVCLGAQIMAASLGAQVYAGTAKEIGWAPLSHVTGVLAPLQDVPVLHWHGDTFELPESALPLASTALYGNQAFALGTYALALQFHLEVAPHEIEPWLIGHSAELGQTGISPAMLRSKSRAQDGRVIKLCEQVIGDWIDQAMKDQPC